MNLDHLISILYAVIKELLHSLCIVRMSNTCIPNNTHIMHTGHCVYNSNGIFKLHSEFQFA